MDQGQGFPQALLVRVPTRGAGNISYTLERFFLMIFSLKFKWCIFRNFLFLCVHIIIESRQNSVRVFLSSFKCETKLPLLAAHNQSTAPAFLRKRLAKSHRIHLYLLACFVDTYYYLVGTLNYLIF